MNPTKTVAYLAALVAALALAIAPVAAAQTTQRGLVNVNLEAIDIGIPVAVAANVCDVSVNALADQIGTGNTACTTDAESGAVFGPGGSTGGANQRGLVNVNVADVTVLVPVSVAANICDVDVNVLAQQRELGRTTCDAVAQSQT
jgi:hypothetical protein